MRVEGSGVRDQGLVIDHRSVSGQSLVGDRCGVNDRVSLGERIERAMIRMVDPFLLRMARVQFDRFGKVIPTF